MYVVAKWVILCDNAVIQKKYLYKFFSPMRFPFFLRGAVNRYAVLLGMLLGIIFFFLNTASSDLMAGILPPGWDEPLQEVEEFYEIPDEGNAVDRIRAFLWKNLMPLFKYIMIAVSVLYGILFLMQMVVSSGNQEQIKEAQQNLLWEFLGFIFIALAADVAEAFDPFVNGGAFVDRETIAGSQNRLVTYIQLIAGVVAVFYIFFAGFRMITAQGDEEIIGEQKNHIKWGFLGLIVIMLVDPLVNQVFYPAEGQRGLGNAELQVMFAEGTGVLRFFLGFTAVLAVVSLAASGFTYATSPEEESKEKARKTILGSLLALVVIVSSYVLIVTFLPPGPVQG